MSQDTLIKELDFVLTHPSCSVEHLETFYNNLLFVYETVPLFRIVNHMRKKKPDLLKHWSVTNSIISSLLDEMEIKNEDLDFSSDTDISEIEVHIKYSLLETYGNGVILYHWKTDHDYAKVESCLKRNKLKVICEQIGELKAYGLKSDKAGQITLYLRKGRNKYEPRDT